MNCNEWLLVYRCRLAREEIARRQAEERAKREEEAQRQAEEMRRREEEERKAEEEKRLQKEREEAQRLQKQVREGIHNRLSTAAQQVCCLRIKDLRIK